MGTSHISWAHEPGAVLRAGLMTGDPLISAWLEVAGTEAGLGEQVLLAVITAAERASADGPTGAACSPRTARGVIRGRTGRHFLRAAAGKWRIRSG